MSEFLANDDRALAGAMAAHLRRAREADWAVAYVRLSFFDVLQSELQDFASRAGRLRLLTGSGQHFTRADALVRLQRLGVQIRIYDAPGVTFHPKLYLFSNGFEAAIVGSANLSGGALSSNLEAAAEITSVTDAAFTQRAREWFGNVWERSVPLSAAMMRWFRANEQNEGDENFTRLFREEQTRYEIERETQFVRERLFQVGQSYTNQDISKTAQVSSQGGIRYHGSSLARPERCIIILSPESASPYRDTILDGAETILYTGEGLRGDQLLRRGNKVLSDQSSAGTPLHAFQKLAANNYVYLANIASHRRLRRLSATQRATAGRSSCSRCIGSVDAGRQSKKQSRRSEHRRRRLSHEEPHGTARTYSHPVRPAARYAPGVSDRARTKVWE